MDPTRSMLTTAWVPLLSGCMMWGGMGHTSGTDGMGEAGHAERGQVPQPLQRAEASSAGVTITLSFPTPSSDAAVVIDAQLVMDSVDADSVDQELIDADVWLRIQTPSGAVDQRRLQQLQSLPPGAYQAQYSFPIAGLYLVTAEARTGTGAAERTVSVTARTQVYDQAHGGQHHWLMPGAILAGLGMVATMALMMGSSGH